MEKMIKVENLTKIYNQKNNQTVALNDISFEVSKGEIFSVIGLSGAGKTTLLRILSKLENKTSGSVLINNQDIFSLKKKELSSYLKRIGVVFQNFSLLRQKTVFQNIMMPLLLNKPKYKKDKKLSLYQNYLKKKQFKKNLFKENYSKVNNLIDLVGLTDKKNSYPSNLSGGQIQRVAIARALVTDPFVLLLDEITSALDPLTTVQILNLLKDINSKLNITIFLITHDMSVVRKISDSLIILYDGIILEKGKTKEVLENPQSEVGKLFLKND